MYFMRIKKEGQNVYDILRFSVLEETNYECELFTDNDKKQKNFV